MNGTSARQHIEDAVRRELFGPGADDIFSGTGVDCSGPSITLTAEDAEAFVYHDKVTGEELLTKLDPARRYGIGVLFGGGTPAALLPDPDTDTSWVTGLELNDIAPDTPQVTYSGESAHASVDDDDFDLTDANSLKPAAMAISFKIRLQEGGTLKVRARGASYQNYAVTLPGNKKGGEWWLRQPFRIEGMVSASTLKLDKHRLQVVQMTAAREDGTAEPAIHRILPQIQVYSRDVPHENDPDLRLITIAMVNTAQGAGSKHALFQCGFEVYGMDGTTIEPYPAIQLAERDHEERSINLLYRNKRTFAIGHGCAATWKERDGLANSVATDPLPAYEVVSLTPNVYLRHPDGSYLLDHNGKRTAVTVSMEQLARGSEQGKSQVDLVLRLYRDWITEQRRHIPDLHATFQEAAERHMNLCDETLQRMEHGWRLVQEDPTAARAFSLANEAMLFQQIRSRLADRKLKVTKADQTFDTPYPEVSPRPEQGQWRPFQIAFVLASLPELVQSGSTQRDLVDLIFFPTGGGKTEAYLGAAAVSLLARRLKNPEDSGTDTLMRYTLRLLTAQQFLRAAALICVLEDIRSRDEAALGSAPFGIGIWLGSTSTPNTWKQAVEALRKMRRDSREKNMFLLSRCPWCGARMGRLDDSRKPLVAGYIELSDKVAFRCPDPQCRFGGRRSTLPIHVVDEDIYESRPSLIIGTVDKFAMTAWVPAAAAIFGLNQEGTRDVSPPNLIIQDELHLISGPLGSMVGLYEPVIEALCTDHRTAPPTLPKIIASTATIRRYEDQVLGVFGRRKVSLFPPQGLEEGHSFFAEPETLDDGTEAPGRRYLGVMSGSLGSLQTVQVRVAAATLMGATKIPDGPERDGYWTNLNFLNSLRELGNTKYLLDSDVPDYLTGLRFRDGITSPRWPRHVLELTSRRRSDEIPQAIDLLNKSYDDAGCVDICLASNIIEVGVDIDRLALMTIVGQPKTTAQYIQVSGRVGRRPAVAPGLVITIYGAAKPRDRSHYERFRTYHQQLYAQVEPTSVTPFATPVLRRALHAATVAFIRQTAPGSEPNPFPSEKFHEAIQLLRKRAELVNAEELPAFDEIASNREREWASWKRTEWSANPIGGNPLEGLMRYAGTLPDLDHNSAMWDIPSSMRNVDAECAIEVSTVYAVEDGKPGGENK